MKTREAVLDNLRRINPAVGAEYGVRSLALFGSYARGDQNEQSDVDVRVDVEPSIGLRFIDLADEIELAVGLPVDAVSLRGVKGHYLEEVEKDLVYV